MSENLEITNGNKTGRKRDDITLLEDRHLVARILHEGVTSVRDIQARINHGRPEDLKVSVVTIRKDIEWLKGQWKESALIDFTEYANRADAELENLKRICFEEFHKSKEPKVTTEAQVPDDQIDTALNGGDPKVRVTKIKEERREGNPVWIQMVEKIIDRQCKLRGIDSPSKIALTNSKGEDVVVDARTSILNTLAAMNQATQPESETETEN